MSDQNIFISCFKLEIKIFELKKKNFKLNIIIN